MKSAPDTSLSKETEEQRQKRHLFQNIEMILEHAKEAKANLEYLESFIHGIKFANPQHEILGRLNNAIAAHGAIRQIAHLANVTLTEQKIL